MWIVRLALQRPYTFIVMALVVILLTTVVVPRTPTDIFPEINIPVISLVWTYGGLQPQEMELRITGNVERGISTLVNDVEHIESQSLPGIAVIKVYFQPGANIQTALAQSAAISQTFLRFLPQGTTPEAREQRFAARSSLHARLEQTCATDPAAAAAVPTRGPAGPRTPGRAGSG